MMDLLPGQGGRLAVVDSHLDHAHHPPDNLRLDIGTQLVLS
jgi:hypothetical protein